MKKLKIIGYIILIAIVAVLSLTIYTNASKTDEEDKQHKALTEIKFIESKMLGIFNKMNNIEAQNYKIIGSEISKQETKSEENSSSGQSSGGQSSSEQSSGGQSSGESSSSEGGTSSQQSSSGQSSNQGESSGDETEKPQKFQLESTAILTREEEVGWNSIKKEIETFYDSIPAITLDLYQTNINQADILSFNSEVDNLTKVIKEEKKEETLAQLSKVYQYIPKFLRASEQDELYSTVVETKNEVLKAYSKLDSQNWDEISNDIKNAISTYSKLLTNISIQKEKQYNVSKTYVMLNELQNAVNLQDTTIFLIKYKNLLEEMSNL